MVSFEQLNLMYRRQAGYAQKFTNRIERITRKKTIELCIYVLNTMKIYISSVPPLRT